MEDKGVVCFSVIYYYFDMQGITFGIVSTPDPFFVAPLLFAHLLFFFFFLGFLLRGKEDFLW